jgi:hypothetical protein
MSKQPSDFRAVLGCILDRCRDFWITALAGAVLLLQPTCSSSSEISCPAGMVVGYDKPGCGAEAKPACMPAAQDACYRPVCSCRGVTISRCDSATEPYRSSDPCPTDGGGTH